MIGIFRVAARIDGPHIQFGLTMDDPLGQVLARTATLGNAEGERVPLERIRAAGHGSHHGQTIGRVGNGPVDVAADTCLAQQGQACHRVLDVELQPFQIVRVELEAEIIGHRIVGRDPMGLAVALVGTEVQPVLLLTQIVRDIDVADDRQLATLFLGPCFQFGNRLGQEILVGHHDHGHGAPAEGFEHLADALGVVASTVHDFLAADVALVGLDDPLIAIAVDAGDGTEALDPRPGLARALGHGLGQLGRVNIAVQRIPHAAQDVVGFHEGVVLEQLVRRADIHLQALITAHARDALEFLHPLFRVRQTQGPRDVVIHGIVHILAQRAVHLGRIALHVHDRPGPGKVGHIASGMPGGPGGQLVLFQQDAVGPTGLGQMVERRGADDTAADNDHTGRAGQISHIESPSVENKLRGKAAEDN